jgi:hypothetical protein
MGFGWLTGLSAAWFVLMLGTPWQVGVFSLALTMSIIIVNLIVSICVLIRHKRILVGLNLLQVGLFGVLHYQVYSTLGAHHYRSEGPVAVGSWLQFTVAHALRAADVLDFVENYGLDLQNLKHRSTFAGLLLVAMHLTVDLFLLTFVLRALLRVVRKSFWERERLTSTQRRELSEYLAEQLPYWQKRCWLPCLLAFVACAWWQQWRAEDWLLWPLDKLIRLLDVADVLEIFHWRLHAVPRNFCTGTLALAFHLFVGLSVARWLNGMHLRVLGRRSLRSLDEVTEGLSEEVEAVRTAAARTLGELGPAAEPAMPALLIALADHSPAVGDAVRRALRAIGPGSADSVVDIIALLDHANWAVRRGAVEALGRMNSDAAEAVPALIAKLADRDPLLPAMVDEALSRIDPYWPHAPAALAALPELQDKLIDRDPRIRQAAADALRRFGPAGKKALPSLLSRLGDAHEYVRMSATFALDQIAPNWRNEIFPVLMA